MDFLDKKIKYTPKVADSKDQIKGDHAFENGIYMLLGKEFGGREAGWEVRWEAKNFKVSKMGSSFLKSVDNQIKGREPKVAEVYFRGRYLCDVREDMTPQQVRELIMTNLRGVILKGGGG